MNRFAIGDLVVCKAGGPTMVVQSVPINPPNNVNVAGGFAQVQFNGFVQPFYTCLWWNVGMNSFNQWNFHEDMLDDAPSE